LNGKNKKIEMIDIIKRIRQHTLPDPHDERGVLHAPLLREAADTIESLCQKLDKANQLEIGYFESNKQLAEWTALFSEWDSPGEVHESLIGLQKDINVLQQQLIECQSRQPSKMEE
jgi:hypothetical protein